MFFIHTNIHKCIYIHNIFLSYSPHSLPFDFDYLPLTNCYFTFLSSSPSSFFSFFLLPLLLFGDLLSIIGATYRGMAGEQFIGFAHGDTIEESDPPSLSDD